MTTAYLLTLLFATGTVTILLRAFPFLAFGRGGKPPAFVGELGLLISPAAIAMLIVYCFCACFSGVSFAEKLYGAAEWIAGATVIVLHLRFRNPLLSIIAGTAVYMLLVQKVFC